MDLSKVQPFLNVKAFVTAVFTLVTALMFYEGRDIPGELMVINTVVIIDYFRSKENRDNVTAIGGFAGLSATQSAAAPLPEPYVPEKP